MTTWQGEYYNPDLSITEIAAIIRADLKKKFPAYRFSVDSRKKREITISLLEYPVELTNKTLIASYFLMMEDDFMFYDVRRCRIKNKMGFRCSSYGYSVFIYFYNVGTVSN